MNVISFSVLGVSDLTRIVEIATDNIFPLWPEGEYRQFLSRPSAVCVGAFFQGSLKGFFLGLLSGSDLDVVAIATDKGFQRKGIAGQLLNEILSSPGINRATLEVDPQNEAAVKLYLSRGFSVVGLRKKYYQGKRDAWLMKWER